MSQGPESRLMKTEGRSRIIPIITGVGVAGTVSQVLVLRELLALFLGNELSMGLALACWLAWLTVGSLAAAGWVRTRRVSAAAIAVVLMATAWALPGSLLACRAARLIWRIPLGELIAPPKMLAVVALATGVICPLLGALFALCWARLSRQRGAEGGPRPLMVYLFEAVGAGAGGLLYYFVLLPGCSALGICLGGSLLLLLGAGWLLAAEDGGQSGGRAPKLCWIACLVALTVVSLFRHDLSGRSQRWQWGPRVIATADTAYHRLALLKDEDQLSLFADGDWWFSLPDRQSVEYGTFLPLLVHRRPHRVLLLGGVLSGSLRALEEHPGITRIDAVEPDPGLFALAATRFPATVLKAVDDPRLHLHLTDAALYLRRHDSAHYDVILLNVGDPVNAGMNRFYTVEFFRAVKAALNDDGLFSFAVSGGESMLGAAQGQFLRSFYHTLGRVFPRVAVFPGDRTRFFAGPRGCDLRLDAQLIMARVGRRGLKLRYIRLDSLEDALSPFRLDYLHALLTQGPAARVNRDFFPVCYYRGLILWASTWQRRLRRFFFAVLNRGAVLSRWWPLWTVLTVLLLGVPWSRRRLGRVYFNVVLVGAVQMVFEILLLLGYQVVAGHIYSRMALIVAAFMFGLAGGAAFSRGSVDIPDGVVSGRRRFMAAQLAVGCYPLVLLGYLHGVHGNGPMDADPAVVTVVFCLFALASGAAGGFHFAAAARLAAALAATSGSEGGRLYGLDVLGAALGALLAGLFLLPLVGLTGSLLITSMAALAGLLLLMR